MDAWDLCRDPAIGFDTAHWQGTKIDWPAAVALGAKWEAAKIWDGSKIVASGQPQLDGARKAKIGVLTRYAWFYPDADLAQQAYSWCSIPREGDETALLIDHEEPKTKLRGRALIANLEWVIEVVSDKTGERPEIYTGDWYWRDFCLDLDSEIVASCELFLAAYPRKASTGTRYDSAAAEVCGGPMPRVPFPWRIRNKFPLRWQFDGDKGLYLPGDIDVDVGVAAWSRLRERVKSYIPPREPLPTFENYPYTPLGWTDRAERELEELEKNLAPPTDDYLVREESLDRMPDYLVLEDEDTTEPGTPASKSSRPPKAIT